MSKAKDFFWGDTLGKLEEKISQVGKNIERPIAGKIRRSFGYLGNIVIYLILIFIASNLYYWNTPHLTVTYNSVVPILLYIFLSSVIANIIYIFYNHDWIKSMIQALLFLAIVYFIYKLLMVYPFDFVSSTFADTLAKVVIVFLLITAFVGFIVEIVKFFVYVTEERYYK